MSKSGPGTLRLGHITYSNCFPVHARFIDQGPPEGVALAQGVPSLLNDMSTPRSCPVATTSLRNAGVGATRGGPAPPFLPEGKCQHQQPGTRRRGVRDAARKHTA